MISHFQYLQFSPHFAQLDVEKPEDRVRFLELWDASPQKIRDFLASMVTAEKIMNIGQIYGLDEFDTEAVALAVRKIAVGEIFVRNAADFIANETELPHERARTLVISIVNDVLSPILEDIKKIQQTKFSKEPKANETEDTANNPVQPGQTRNPNILDLRNTQN